MPRSSSLASLRTSGKPALPKSHVEREEVRNLGFDKPTVSESQGCTEGTHQALMARLKSRAARVEAEAQKCFLASYKQCSTLDKESEVRFDRMLKAAQKKAEELKQHSDELIRQVAEAERAVEAVKSETTKATETQLAAMTAFQRSQYVVKLDKREEELQARKDEAQSEYHKVHRRLQSELIELRDYKVLLGEYRRLRLDKLQENLGRVTDGRKLRQIVREMIRQGGQRVLSRLQASALPLEPWMSEVVVNCCHLEIRMEDAQRKQKPLQRKALKPLKDQVTRMVEQPKDTRFTRLCAWTWDNIKESEADAEVELPGSVSASAWTRDDPSRWSQKANPWKKPPMPADETFFDNSAASSPTIQKKKTNEVLLKLPEEIPKQQEKHGSLLSRIAALAPPKDQDESKSKASSVLHKLAEKAQGGFVAVVTQALLEKRQVQAEKEERDAAKREMQQRRRERELARQAAAAADDVSNTKGTADKASKEEHEKTDELIDAAVKASRAAAAADPKMASRAAAADNQPIDAEDLPMVNEFAAQTPEVLAAEAEVQALQQLLEDTRQNAAAAICSKIKQAEKGGGRNGVSAMQWGNQMLTLLVSEDFAKAATKELRKSQPQAMMLH